MLDVKHPLLKRQLRRLAVDQEELPSSFSNFVQAIDKAYESYEDDRAMLERTLQTSSEEIITIYDRLQTIFATIPDLYLWVDQFAVITEVKACTQEQHPFGGQRPEVGASLKALLADDASEVFQLVLKESQASHEVQSFEYRTEYGNQTSNFEVRVVPTAKKQTLVIFQDITTRKREESLRIQQSKLDSVGLLAGGIAHDFNNILTVISGGVSISLLDVEQDSEAAEILDDIESSVHRARQLTQQLLTFSKGGSPVRESASIADLIHESMQFALRGSNVRSEVSIADDLWPVLIDSGQINQVLNNLVINADQAMKRGGLLLVTAQNCDMTNEVRLTFSDEGEGIPAEFLDRIFDPYFTTKSEGNGLGLASSHAIIRKHGGSLNVHSVVGKGTTFVISLPRSTDIPPPPPLLHSEPTRGKGRILVMDDEAPIRTLARRMLQRLGYQCVTAAGGSEAIKIYKHELLSGRKFQGIIMDLTIPGGLGGKEALETIRKFDPNVCAIASSGYSNAPVLSEFQSHGFVGILPKPYNIRELSSALENLDFSPMPALNGHEGY